MCCGAEPDSPLFNAEKSLAYNQARQDFVGLEADWAVAFNSLEACVSDYDVTLQTPESVKAIMEAWEKAFNEILQSKNNVELLHHYAQMQKMLTGLQNAANLAFHSQYQLYQSEGSMFLDAPAGVENAQRSAREALGAVPALA